MRKTLRELMVRSKPEEVQTVERELLELKRRLREGPRLEPGDRLSNRYSLIDELGSGGFGTVGQAFDEVTNHHVALKVLHGQFSNNAERRERF